MKKITIVSSFLATVLILGSCSSTNDVVSNGFISKRKYNSGFHIDMKKRYKSSKGEEVQKDVLANSEKSKEAKKEAYETVAILPKSDVKSAVGSSQIQPVQNEVQSTEKVGSISKSETGSITLNSVQEVKKVENAEPTLSIKTEASKKEMKKEVRKELLKKKNKRSPMPEDLMFILCIILAIVLPPIGVLVYTNIDWLKVLICLLLCFVFILPGIIYALLVVLGKL